MSRIGKQPLKLPSGVQARVEGRTVFVQGPLGKLEYLLGDGVKVEVDQGVMLVSVTSQSKQAKSNWGSTRAYLGNMVTGVTSGWKKSLELVGVGYNASLQGQKLKLGLGLSHDVELELPAGVKANVTKTTIVLESPDKQLVGNVAAKIRRFRPPEPYLGKGVKLSDEVIRRKAGKTGK
ncbi:MAG: 50S ribosomal protein L6 [Bdellovibrionales bacterium]|nr:50S ribosomal protein L6 [Bdellovibrionales bacterium]